MVVKLATKPPEPALDVHYWPPPQGEWTYEDYARLPSDGMRYEVINGELHMTPAPRPQHQKAIFILAGRFWEYLQRKPVGEAYVAPIDVILPGRASPVQPDLLFIARDRLAIVTEDLIEGTPDLIVEVLSPSNPWHDRRTKYQLYARAGVREYWIVDPQERTVDIYVLRGRAFAPLGSFGPDENIRSEVLADFSVPVGEICPE